MEIIDKHHKQYSLRWVSLDEAPAIRLIANAAYQELADMGLNYTATFQDETETRRRMSKGRTLLVQDGEHKPIGTILMFESNKITGRRSAYFGQFGFLPEYKGRGLGSRVMDFVEDLARREGYECAQLDTAKPAKHLVDMYLKRGYRIIGETHFEGKTYDSWIFEKDL